MEKRLKLLLDEKDERIMRQVNEKASGLILCGVIIGVILSYSSFLGYTAGVVSGITISTKFEEISNVVTLNCMNLFHRVIQMKNERK